MTGLGPDADTESNRSLLSVLNNVFFVLVLIALAIGGVFLALDKI